MMRFEAEWRNIKPLEPAQFSYDKNWPEICNNFLPAMRNAGFNSDSKLHFIDDIPGPHTLATKPGQTLLKFDAAYLAEDYFEETRELMFRNPRFMPNYPRLLSKDNILEIFRCLIDDDI
jgi:hypothetical protein